MATNSPPVGRLLAAANATSADAMDALIVRHVNLELRRLAGELPADPDHRFGFNCECGCGHRVPLTAAEYDQNNGAWAEGHNRSYRDLRI
jgi:hypothetical protein